MTRRSGLGRGLESLIPTGSPTPGSDSDTGDGFRLVPIAAVRPNRFQPRVDFDEATLEGLTQSIRSMGVLQPILVRPDAEGGYELIAGERRWRAALRAGLDVIPAIIRSTQDEQSLEEALVENLHRQDLNPMEEAAAVRQLIDDFRLTQESVAKRIGRSRSAVANLLRLLLLPAPIQAAVRDGSLTSGHAKVLAGVADEQQALGLAERAVGEGLTVRALEQLIQGPGADASGAGSGAHGQGQAEPSQDRDEYGSGASGDGPVPLRPPGILELEELLSHRLDTEVAVKGGAGRGRVVIEFAGLEDLERIARIIAGA